MELLFGLLCRVDKLELPEGPSLALPSFPLGTGNHETKTKTSGESQWTMSES